MVWNARKGDNGWRSWENSPLIRIKRKTEGRYSSVKRWTWQSYNRCIKSKRNILKAVEREKLLQNAPPESPTRKKEIKPWFGEITRKSYRFWTKVRWYGRQIQSINERKNVDQVRKRSIEDKSPNSKGNKSKSTSCISFIRTTQSNSRSTWKN